MQEGYSFDKAYSLVKKFGFASYKVKSEKANPVLAPQDQKL